MSFGRIGDSHPTGRDGIAPVAGTHELERRDARSHQLDGTLACDRCDAPVALAQHSVSPGDGIVCPFCGRRGAVRDFLSLELPTRPARVTVHIAFLPPPELTPEPTERGSDGDRRPGPTTRASSSTVDVDWRFAP